MNNQDYLVPFEELPSIDDFLKEEYWALHEAAFVFTEWPKNGLRMSFRTGQFIILEGEKEPEPEVDRFCIYQSEEHRFDPKKYGKKFKLMYDALVDAIVNGHLDCKIQKYGRLVFFVTPRDVIMWALVNGYVFPKQLQKALGFHRDMIEQQLPSKENFTLCKKVGERIVAQYILAKDPNLNRTQLCKEVLRHFNILKTNPEPNGDITAIRQNLNTLFLIEGKRGRRKHTSSDFGCSYCQKPIPEVLQIDISGTFCYNFALFKTAMMHASYFKIFTRNSDDFSELRVEEFFEEFKIDPIVSLYVKTNKWVLKIVKDCVYEAWKDSMYLLSVKDIADQYDREQKEGKI